MAAIEHWRETNNILAKLIDKKDIKGYSRKDLVLDPGEAAVLIADGRIEDTLTQTRLKKVGGGFSGWLSRKLKVGKDLKLLLVDAKPFTLKFPVKAPTADHIQAKGGATIELQFDLNAAPKILGMIREKPVYVTKGLVRKRQEVSEYVMLLTKDHLRERLGDEIAAKVFTTLLANYSAGQLRESATQARLETATQIEMRKTLGLWGLSLQSVFVNWQATAYDEFRATKAVEDMASGHQLEQQAREQQATLDAKRREELQRLEIERLEDEQDAAQLAGLVKLKGQMKEQKINEFQQTELKKTEVEANRDIEVSKHSLDTYKDAQSAERSHSLNMMGEMAKIFSGQQGAQVPQANHATPPPSGPACPQCNAPLSSAAGSCPECGWLNQG